MIDTTVDVFAAMRSLMEKGEYKQALVLVAVFGDQFPMMEPYYQEHHPDSKAHCQGIYADALVSTEGTVHAFFTKDDVIDFLKEKLISFAESCEFDVAFLFVSKFMPDLDEDSFGAEEFDEMIVRLETLNQRQLFEIASDLEEELFCKTIGGHSNRITVNGMKQILSTCH